MRGNCTLDASLTLLKSFEKNFKSTGVKDGVFEAEPDYARTIHEGVVDEISIDTNPIA